MEESSVLSFGACVFFSPFWLPGCIREICYDSSLGRVAVCKRCPVGPSGAVSLITWAGSSRNVPFAHYVGLPVVSES